MALQYTPCEGIASVREYLVERQEQLQGRRPEPGELIVTSGGMECIALMCQALIDPGDAIAVEAPTYLGALMAFGRAEAEAVPIAMDEDGLRVDELAERLAAGLRPKFVYTIPEYQNPTGRTLPLERRHALVELCRRHGVLILEDVAYRELAFDGRRCRRCGRWRPTSCCRRARSPRASSPACGSAGPAARPTWSPSWPPRSRTPTSARAGSASGWSRSTAAPGASSATCRTPASSTPRTGRRCRRR